MKKLSLFFAFIITATLILTGCGKSKTPYDFDLSQYITPAKFPQVEYKNSDMKKYIDEQIEELCSDNAEDKEVTDRAVKKGDIVNIDYSGAINVTEENPEGEVFDGGTDTGHNLTIGSNAFISGFEDGLIGKNTGEEVKLNLKFPESYENNPDLAGKPVVFTVKINKITENVVPEFSDEIAKKDGAESAEAYREEKKKEYLTNNIWNKVIEGSTVIELPRDEVREYYNTLVKRYETMAASNGMMIEDMIAFFGYNNIDSFLNAMYSDAAAQIKEEMVVYSLVRSNNITISEEEYQTKGLAVAQENGHQSLEDLEETAERKYIEYEIYKDILIEMAIENAVGID